MSDDRTRIHVTEIVELAELLRRIDDFEYGRDGRGGKHPPPSYARDTARVVAIGRAANEAGGFAQMYRLAMATAERYRNAANTLNAHWHGIGEWLE